MMGRNFIAREEFIVVCYHYKHERRAARCFIVPVLPRHSHDLYGSSIAFVPVIAAKTTDLRLPL